MFIKEIMKSPVIMVQSEITIKEAINKMNDFNIGSIIIGSYEKIEGIFSERDVLKKCLELDLNKTSIDKVMTKKVITISEEETYLKAFEIMNQKNIRSIPVVNKNGLCVGIVGIKDIMETACLILERENKELISYIVSNPIISTNS